MTINDISTILSAANLQATGNTISQLNSDTLVDIGKSVLDGDKDGILSALTNVIGKTAVMNRTYNSVYSNFILSEFEYGQYLRRIYIKMFEPTTDNDYDIEDSTDYSPYIVSLPDVTESFFSNTEPFGFDVTITENQLTTAFKSAEELGAFIDGIYTAMRNSIEDYIDTANRTAINTAMAQKIQLQNVTTESSRRHAVNLLSEYNTAHGLTGASALTAAKCLYDKDFITFANATIVHDAAKMRLMNTIYARGGYKTFSDELKLIENDLFVTAAGNYLTSQVYNPDKLSIKSPDLVVPFWQSMDSELDIDIRIDDGTSTKKRIQSKILAFLCDRKIIGTTVKGHRTGTAYNPRKNYTNIFERLKMGYFADLLQCGCVYYIADPATT